MPEHDVTFGGLEFRDVMGHFCTGVVVITSSLKGAPYGLTCQSFVSVSLAPPLVLFSPSKSSTSWPAIRESGRFSVNVLADDQRTVSDAFAKSGGEKFLGIAWTASETGYPTIAGCLAHVECAIEEIYDGGDHDLVLGRVENLTLGPPGLPLLFFRGDFVIVAPSASGHVVTGD